MDVEIDLSENEVSLFGLDKIANCKTLGGAVSLAIKDVETYGQPWRRFHYALEAHLPELEYLVARYGLGDCEMALNAYKARLKRVQHVRQFVGDLVLNDSAIFLTLTFKPAVLASTSILTRRRYVSRFLKEQCLTYVANIDFGEKNGREHYHAIVTPKGKKIDLKKWSDPMGDIDAERIRAFGTDLSKCSKYIVKLSRHCVKDSTGFVNGGRMIYSRVNLQGTDLTH